MNQWLLHVQAIPTVTRKTCGWGWGGVNSPWGDPAPLSSCPWCCPSQTPLLPCSHSPCCRSTSVSRTTLISLHWTSLESQFMLLQLLVNYWIKNYFFNTACSKFYKTTFWSLDYKFSFEKYYIILKIRITGTHITLLIHLLC